MLYYLGLRQATLAVAESCTGGLVAVKRAVVWKSLLIDGTDYCGLWHTAEGWLLKGTVVGVLKDQRPMLASYEIHCDENSAHSPSSS